LLNKAKEIVKGKNQ
jgi:hypothetical protein